MHLNQQCQCPLDCSSIVLYLLVSLYLLSTTHKRLFFCILPCIRIVHFFQADLRYHVILVERAHVGILINRSEKSDFRVYKLNENMASPTSDLFFFFLWHYIFQPSKIQSMKEDSFLYYEDVSFRHQGSGRRGLNLLFPYKLRSA